MPNPAAIRTTLTTGSSPAKQLVLEALARGQTPDETLLDVLLPLLLSHEVAPRDSSWSMAEHTALAPIVFTIVESWRATDDRVFQALFNILDAGPTLNWHFPQASFDQGMYIGEYHAEEVKPALLACRALQRLLPGRPDLREPFFAILAKHRISTDIDLQRAACAANANAATPG